MTLFDLGGLELLYAFRPEAFRQLLRGLAVEGGARLVEQPGGVAAQLLRTVAFLPTRPESTWSTIWSRIASVTSSSTSLSL